MKTMKKIVYIFSALLLLLMGSVSCNVTREPEVTPKQKPFENLKEAQMNRDAVYALLREVESPNNLDGIEIQGDLYHPTFLAFTAFIAGSASPSRITMLSYPTTPISIRC